MTYKLDDFQDYFYGYMVPSTGYLKYFRLEDAGRENQFLLRHPVTGSNMQIGALEKYKRMRPIFEEYSSWQKNLNIHMLSSVNKAIDEGRIEDLILVSESPVHQSRGNDRQTPGQDQSRDDRRTFFFRENNFFQAAFHRAADPRYFPDSCRNGQFLP